MLSSVFCVYVYVSVNIEVVAFYSHAIIVTTLSRKPAEHYNRIELKNDAFPNRTDLQELNLLVCFLFCCLETSCFQLGVQRNRNNETRN